MQYYFKSDYKYPYEPVFQGHLKKIIDACRQLSPNLDAVILYGSYGRGEGGWYKNRDGIWKPYNDYDICLVSSQSIPRSKLIEVEKELAKKIDIKWIDISHKKQDDLCRLKPSILNYDFRNGSVVIDGNYEILNMIPNFSDKSIRMKDASILYFTRMYALVGSLREDGFHQCLKGEESRFFRYQMSKAILAIVDVMLLRKNVYDSSYKKRAKLIQSYYPDRKEFHSLVMWALQEKLYPKSSVMEPEATRELYELVLEYFIMEMYPSLSMYYNYPIRGPEDIEYCMKWKPGQIFKRIYWMIRYGKLIERNMAVHLSQSYLISSYEKNSTNNHYLSKAIDLIRSVDECIPISLSWDQARIHAAELRIKM